MTKTNRCTAADAGKPWVEEVLYGDEVIYRPKTHVFIREYLVDGHQSLGQWDDELQCYVLDDGDGHGPEEMDWLGESVHFFTGPELLEILNSHFERAASHEPPTR